MPRRNRVDLEDMDFHPLPDDALELFPGAVPANVVGRSAYIRDFTEPDADVSGFGDLSGLGDVPENENLKSKFSTVGSKSYQRADYAPINGKRPVIAEFARPDSRYGIDPCGSDFGFPEQPYEFKWSGFDGLGIGPRKLRAANLITGIVQQLLNRRIIERSEVGLAASALHNVVRGHTADVSEKGFHLLQRIAPRIRESVRALRKGQ